MPVRFSGLTTPTCSRIGPDEITEIADIIIAVLRNVTPLEITGEDGTVKTSKAKFGLPQQVADAAQDRVSQLLKRYPLYSEIDISLAYG